MKKKPQNKTIHKICAVCGKKIQILLQPDGKYKGGHYFGKIPLPKGGQSEYWECENCATET